MRKYWLIGGGVVGGLLLLLVAAVLIVPNLIPQEVYRAKIEEVGSQALGRKVTVTGNISIGVFPRIEAKAGASTIANPEGFDQPNFASMKELRAAVSLWPLLFGNVEVEEFVLVEPTITLVSLEDGKNNWTFTPAPGPAADPAKPSQGGTMGASLRDVRIEKGYVSFDDRKENKIQTLSDFNFSADMQALDKPLSFKADGLANDLKFNIESKIENPKATIDGTASPVEIKLQTDLIRTDLKGTLGLGDKPKFDFAITGEIPQIATLSEAFKAPLPATIAGVLGKLTLAGKASGTFDDIAIQIDTARHESPLLTADLKGQARIADGITLALQTSAEAPNLAQLTRAMNISAPAEAALGKATISAKIAGKPDDLQFTDVNFAHASGLLNLLFAGSAHLKDNLTYAGNVTIEAPDLRKLATAAGATLPPGDIYKRFKFTGQTSGGATDVLLKNATVAFDNITGTGEAALSFGAKPRLTGTLSTSAIDITSYASASGAPAGKPTTTTQGWGATPIDLSPLKLVDAALTLKAAGVKYDKFSFGPSNIAVTLTDGRLVADLKQTSLFSGTGSARFVADGSTAKPAIELKAKMDKLAVKDLLSASAGFTMLEGVGGLDIDIAGSGGTLQTLMSSLVGQGQFAFDDSVLKGVNLTELGAAASTALTTKKFSTSAFSSNAQTAFNALNAGFAMKDGVAVLTGMKIDAGTMTIDAGGALDIGRQELSLNLFPVFADKKAGLNGYGLPMKLSGGWGGVKFAPDWGFLADKATAGAKAKVQSEIQDELKGISNGLLGKLGIGSTKQPATTPAPAAPAADPATPAQPAEAPAATPAAPAEKPQSVEDRLKAEAQKKLKGLFPGN